MATYEIEQTATAVILDRREADSQIEAWQEHLRAMGYSDAAQAAAVGCTWDEIPDDISVTKIDVTVTAVGGTSFDARRGDEYLGRIEVGEIDDDGQYVGGDDDVIEAVRAEYDLGVAETVRVVM